MANLAPLHLVYILYVQSQPNVSHTNCMVNCFPPSLSLIPVPCRGFLKLFQGTLFKNKKHLLMFIRYSHPVCLKLNKPKRRSIVKLGSKQDLTTALEEVCTDLFNCGNLALLSVQPYTLHSQHQEMCCDWIHIEL